MTDRFLSAEGLNEIRKRLLAVGEALGLPEEHPDDPHLAGPMVVWRLLMEADDDDLREEYEEWAAECQEGAFPLPVPRFNLSAMMVDAAHVTDLREMELEGFPPIRVVDVSDEFLECAAAHGLVCAGVSVTVHGAPPNTVAAHICEALTHRVWILQEHEGREEVVPWLTDPNAVPPTDDEPEKPRLRLV